MLSYLASLGAIGGSIAILLAAKHKGEHLWVGAVSPSPFECDLNLIRGRSSNEASVTARADVVHLGCCINAPNLLLERSA